MAVFSGNILQNLIGALKNFFSHLGMNVNGGAGGGFLAGLFGGNSTTSAAPENHTTPTPAVAPQKPVTSIDKSTASGAFANNDITESPVTGAPQAPTPGLPVAPGQNQTAIT